MPALTLDRTIELLKAILVVMGAILLVVLFIQSGGHAYPPGTLVPNEPVQTDTTSRTWEKNGYTITALARYRIEAFVISTEPYWFDPGSALSPIDFAVGWGPLSDPATLGRVSFSQGRRWFNYRIWGNWPVPKEVIDTHSANMHLIPADRRIEQQLKSIHTRDIVNMNGYLVEVQGANQFKWRSSLTRTDTGGGACELMWVEEITKRP